MINQNDIDPIDTTLWEPVLELMWKLLNSNLPIALIGAFTGAYAATLIADKKEKKNRLIEEVQHTNAAIAVTYSIVNNACNLKEQYVQALKEDFDENLERYIKFKESQKNALDGERRVFKYEADFVSVSPVKFPIDILKDIIFKKISMTGISLSLVPTLSLSIDSLNETLSSRNELIKLCKESSYSQGELVKIYFGLPDDNGFIDRSYPDYIKGISDLTDDCIFFGKFLGEKLNKHGKELVVKLKSKDTKIHSFDFTEAEKKGLMPDEKPYEKWKQY